MPEVSRAQFLKANPNQQALPGMENASHPGAALLRQGYHFEHESLPQAEFGVGTGQHHNLVAVTSNGVRAGEMSWPDKRESGGAFDKGLGRGEISWVHTDPAHRRQGVATALYGIGRTMARVKPRHSTNRSIDGDHFAEASVADHGGRVPKKKLY